MSEQNRESVTDAMLVAGLMAFSNYRRERRTGMAVSETEMVRAIWFAMRTAQLADRKASSSDRDGELPFPSPSGAILQNLVSIQGHPPKALLYFAVHRDF
jgi:hypothetical protein